MGPCFDTIRSASSHTFILGGRAPQARRRYLIAAWWCVNHVVYPVAQKLTHIDLESEPGRYEELVRAMVDALDRQVARDDLASNPPTAARLRLLATAAVSSIMVACCIPPIPTA